MAATEDHLIDLTSSDAKKMTEDQQIYLLRAILEDAKQVLNPELARDKEIHQLISDCQESLELGGILNGARDNINKLIAFLEQHEGGQPVLDHFKKNGVYRILYRNARMRGQDDQGELKELLNAGFIGVGVSAVLIAFFVATTLIGGAPFWLTAVSAGLFTGASAYLSGILYGVVNDLFATKANLPYFLLGHQRQQNSMLRTNDKVAQGIAWGVAATFPLVAMAAVAFTVIATTTAFFVPLATFVLPVMMVAMPLIAVGADFYAQKMAKQHVEQHGKKLFNLSSRLNVYQHQGLDIMCQTQEELAAWLANSDRNVFGFYRVPFIGLGALVGFVGLSALSAFIPPVLFASPIIAMAVPAAFAGVAALTLAVGGIYTYVNRNKQLDDRYRLEFSGELKPGLYLEEDQEYIQTLLRKYPNPADAPVAEKTTEVTEEPQDVPHFGPVIQLPSSRPPSVGKPEEENQDENENHIKPNTIP
ncbi:hypothetical protein [Legionella saoudiensis]|uniref:hypothetical protein n=1 Tax=Legionella saoudiensis TaxID=1750561 RepID=UPI0007319E35|nr:hypothetical protein [Legionella saoudiensis]